MIKFNIITLFPELFESHLSNLPFKRAIEEKDAEYNLCNLRDYALDSYGTVDSKPYSGGVGMLLRVEPIYKALIDTLGDDFIESIVNKPKKNKRIVLTSPRGQKFNQKMAEEWKNYDEITFICGRYEGIDNRVEENLVTDIVSIGDYVVSGGELPTLVMMESITRLLPNVLKKEDATNVESFSEEYDSEFPQYTRPQEFKGWTVPEVLISGNHKEIEKWKKDNSKISSSKKSK